MTTNTLSKPTDPKIAAAPDLLAACKAALKATDRPGEELDGETYDLYMQLSKAIAKAEGRDV